jgi:hypothetical protein
MKVIITRTSQWSVDPGRPPVEGARIERVWVTESRIVKTFHDYDSRGPRTDPWTSVGRNHRETENGITREIEKEHWVIDIDDVWAFAKLVDRELVISAGEGFPSVEIYDDYRE